MMLVNNPEISRENAILANKFYSVGWISFAPIFSWFVLVLINEKRVLKNKFFYLILFGLPILFIYQQSQNNLINDFVRTYYGWSHVWSDSIWKYLFYAYYSIFTLLPIGLLLNFYHKSTTVEKRRQIRIIIISSIAPLILGSATNVLLQEIGFHKIPSLADVIALTWSGGIIYAMVKYKFLSITPATAAENIISTMSDALILIDLQGKIMTVNQAALKLSGYSKKELENMDFGKLFMEDDFKQMVTNKAIHGETLNNYNLLLITKEKKNIPVIFSNSLLKDKDKNITGIVCIAKDITKLKETEKQLEKRAWELESKIKELEKIQKLTVNRETKMIELKKENKDLYKEIANLKEELVKRTQEKNRENN